MQADVRHCTFTFKPAATPASMTLEVSLDARFTQLQGFGTTYAV